MIVKDSSFPRAYLKVAQSLLLSSFRLASIELLWAVKRCAVYSMHIIYTTTSMYV